MEKSATRVATLEQFKHKHLGQNNPYPVHPPSWHEPVKEAREIAAFAL
jgi:hypothetical protein